MTNTIYEENKTIQYLYEEMELSERAEMEQEMAKDPILQKEVDELAEAKACSEAAELSPSDRVVDRILAYARQVQLPQEQARLDETHTH